MTAIRQWLGECCAAAAVGLGLICGTVWAESTPAKPEASGALEEIVVTAQRRSESQARVPVSVTALSADALQRQAIITESDLPASVPGLVVRATTNSNQLNQ